MVVQSIPFTAIVEYSRIYELGDFDDFLYIIRRMDNVFLDLNENSKKSEGKKKSATTNADKRNPDQG